MFFDNLPLEMACPKCGKQINETVNWLKAERVGNVPFATRSSTQQSFDVELMRLQIALMKCFGIFRKV
jgi:hypothetical protein